MDNLMKIKQMIKCRKIEELQSKPKSNINGDNCLDCLSEIDLNFANLQDYIRRNFNLTDLMNFENPLKAEEYEAMSKLELINLYHKKTMELW